MNYINNLLGFREPPSDDSDISTVASNSVRSTIIEQTEIENIATKNNNNFVICHLIFIYIIIKLYYLIWVKNVGTNGGYHDYKMLCQIRSIEYNFCINSCMWESNW